LANGLNSHLDFFNDGGATPDDGRYRWTACMQRVKGRWKEYAIRFTDGNVALESLAAFPVICVRGKPANPEADCPGKKNSKSHAFSQATAGAVLLLPLAVVLAVRCLRPRQQ
jgi:hypothetical protein